MALVIIGRRHYPAGTCDGQNVKWNDLIDIPQSRVTITSTCANILKDNRSSFLIDPDGSPNHDALPTHESLSITHASA